MVLSDILKNNVNLPVIGSASAGVIIIGALAIFLLTRRKKSISLKI